MGGKGKSGPVSDNQAIVGMQLQQSQQAANANAARNARLAYGKQLIQQLFEGTPSGSTPLDFSSITQGNAPKSGDNPQIQAALNWGYNHNSDPNLIAQLKTMQQGSKASLPGGYSWGIAPDTGAGTTYAIYDPSGNMVDQSANLADLAAAKIYAGGDPSKKQGGFGDEFYGNYRNSILNYMMPQEGSQYNDARSSLAYSLARAGQSDSSTATMDIAKLGKQDALNRANIAAQADTQTGTLRTTVAQDEQTALNQLYSTEDPSVAANTAGNMVANANLTKPLLNPVGALFAPITAGVGNALTGFLNPTAYINPNAASASTPQGTQDYSQIHTSGA